MIPLSILGRLWGLLSRLRAFVGRYPLHCALVASLALCWASWQRGDRYRDKLASTVSAYQAAQREALAAAEQAKAAQEAKYRSLAHAADQSYQAGLASGSSRLAAYVAAHRMRANAQGSTGQAIATAQGDSAGVPAIAPAETVLAELSDLRACDADYAYAQAAYLWAQGLKGN